jgi:HEAT repeat protein
VVVSGHLGNAEAARSALDDPDPAVRASALGALSRTGSLAADDLRRAWADPAPRVRARAAELSVPAISVPAIDGPDIDSPDTDSWVGHLVAGLSDGDWRVVEASCFALGEMGDAASLGVDELRRVVTSHPDPLCREAAVAALGAIGSPAGLEAILAATTDKPAVRRRAVLALSPYEGERVEAALRTALSDRDWQVRQAAEDLTGEHG